MKKPKKALMNAMKECMSPQTVSVIAAWLQTAKCGHEQVDTEVKWFADRLVKLLGGDDEFNRIWNGVYEEGEQK